MTEQGEALIEVGATLADWRGASWQATDKQPGPHGCLRHRSHQPGAGGACRASQALGENLEGYSPEVVGEVELREAAWREFSPDLQRVSG